MFSIDVSNMHWITEGDDPYDLCAHGYVTVNIGNELLEFEGTVSTAALRLLKTITENHAAEYNGEQMIPHCGHFIIPNDALDNVAISGCDSGLDWTVLHENEDSIKNYFAKPNRGNHSKECRILKIYKMEEYIWHGMMKRCFITYIRWE